MSEEKVYQQASLASAIVDLVNRVDRAYEKQDPDILVPAVAKMLIQGCALAPVVPTRNSLENLMDILNEALCYHEDGVPE